MAKTNIVSIRKRNNRGEPGHGKVGKQDRKVIAQAAMPRKAKPLKTGMSQRPTKG
jgi:hypothetical protein